MDNDTKKEIEKLAHMVQAGFAAVDDHFRAVDKRFENIELDIKAIRADVAHIREDLRRFDYRVTNLERDVATLKAA